MLRRCWTTYVVEGRDVAVRPGLVVKHCTKLEAAPGLKASRVIASWDGIDIARVMAALGWRACLYGAGPSVVIRGM